MPKDTASINGEVSYHLLSNHTCLAIVLALIRVRLPCMKEASH